MNKIHKYNMQKLIMIIVIWLFNTYTNKKLIFVLKKEKTTHLIISHKFSINSPLKIIYKVNNFFNGLIKMI